ncbi:MAG TPA: hypothetical protein VH916_13785 [Dehalococcoidia bacterium]
MDLGRILEAQERRRQELRETTRRAVLLRQLDLANAAARSAEVSNERRRYSARTDGWPSAWLRALVRHTQLRRRA